MPATFFKTVGDSLLFSGDGELIYYVPEKYFDNSMAVIIGEYVSIMGVFTYGVFDKNGKREVFKPFKAPTLIQCKPYKIEKEPEYHLEGTKSPKPYRFLYFKKDDELITHLNVSKEFDNVEKFNNLFMRGNLPDNIPYDKVYEYLIANAELNNFDYKVSYQILGLPISEIYRDPKDPSKPFRLSGMNDMLDYVVVSIDKAPKYNSPFTAITSDNADEAVAAALTVKGKTVSPLEKIMMG